MMISRRSTSRPSAKPAVQQQNTALSAQLAAEKAQVGRLQGAIKYTVNSDLLFSSGGWEMRPQGKAVIARLAAKLAPTQQNKIMVNGYTDNAPIGPELQARASPPTGAVAKASREVMAYLISQGVKPDLVEAHGMAIPIRWHRTPRQGAWQRTVVSN